ncbi:hypothetical protein AsAng_0027750 [Aureispira anguillae]|uniref:Uncharacterized protein n=1 Tax=Aureispira anguillae TaxID=2864201 RepID=A0A915YFG4_9BACT|nr:hypothetical protein AsAng_0027750 [Aureispira anguillae]
MKKTFRFIIWAVNVLMPQAHNALITPQPTKRPRLTLEN